MESRDRNFDFSLSEKKWHSISLINNSLNALSLMFPDGEKYFIKAVRHFESHAGEKLAEDIKIFYRQEAKHSREHRKWNDVVDMYSSVDTTALQEKMVKRLNGAGSEPLDALIATVVLEELTGFGAAVLNRFGDVILLGTRDPEVAELWRWHAIEEAEHIHVARELLKKVDPSKLRLLMTTAKTLWHFAGTFKDNYRAVK